MLDRLYSPLNRKCIILSQLSSIASTMCDRLIEAALELVSTNLAPSASDDIETICRQLDSQAKSFRQKYENDKTIRENILQIQAKVLEHKTNYLRLVKQDYESHLNQVGTSNSRGMAVINTQLNVIETMIKQSDLLIKKDENKLKELDNEYACLELKFKQYQRLDPVLLAQYKRIKEDLECIDTLIHGSF